MLSTVLGPMCIPRWVRHSSSLKELQSGRNQPETDETVLTRGRSKVPCWGSCERLPEEVVFGLSHQRVNTLQGQRKEGVSGGNSRCDPLGFGGRVLRKG